jgi:hypothetical protein
VRGICRILNDLLFLECQRLKLNDWRTNDIDIGETRNSDIKKCLNELKNQAFTKEIEELVSALAEFDWRSSNAKELTSEESQKKAAFRGAGGYGLMRSELMNLVSKKSTNFGRLAQNILASE